MSDASEVKRWSFDEVAEEHWSNRPANFYINGADHDRIMAERDELWKRATKFVMPGEMDTGESIEHYIKTLEQANDKLKAELANRDTYERSWLVAKEIEIGAIFVGQLSEMEETIARQSRVIEKLREQRNYYCDMAQMPDKSYQEHLEECDAELAVIEQGEGT